MMKKLIVVAAAALVAAGAQAASYKDGSYTGEGKGRESQIQVQVDVAGGKIAAVKVLKHGETDMIIAAPIETMIPEIVAKNGVEGVESVGGATMSSDGIKAAVQDALAKARSNLLRPKQRVLKEASSFNEALREGGSHCGPPSFFILQTPSPHANRTSVPFAHLF